MSLELEDGNVTSIDGEDVVPVSPMHERPGSDGMYKYNYTFSRVYIEDVDWPIEMHGRTYEYRDGYVVSEYEDKPTIFITQDDVFVKEDEHGHEARMQAYYTVSILESLGYVSGWKKND